MNIPNRYAPPASNVADVVSQESAPPLWNPNAAANWSLLFSPIFGALVHRKNWQALGEEALADRAKLWAIASAVAIFLSGLMSVFATDGGPDFGRSIGIALLIGWYVAAGRAQAKYVKERFGKDYPRRGWGKPLLIAFGVFAAFIGAAMVLGFVIAMGI